MKPSSLQIANDLANGFHLHSALLLQTDRCHLLGSSDEWEVLAGILLSCQCGDFAALPRIPELLRKHDGFRFWKAATELLGYAGSWKLLDQVFESFHDQLDDRGVQYLLPIALANTCGLWAVEPLLALHGRAVDEEPRYQIQRHLSYLLEEEDGPIRAGQEEEVIVDPDDIEVRTVVDYVGFARKVREARDLIVERMGSPNRAVYEGRVLDIGLTARTLYERVTGKDSGTGRIYREQMLFEASTGIDCRGFYDEENSLQYLSAAAIMEDALSSHAFNRFEPGRRYFFGHPVGE
jgi:hypothetical protein